jgi:hypothetical protein
MTFASLSNSRALDMITKKTQHRVIQWMRTRPSAEAAVVMACWLAFGIRHGAGETPQDPADFESCLLLLGAVPELRSYLRRMAKLSPAWKVLVQQWPDIEATFIKECGQYRCPKTAAMIRAAGASLAEAI